MKCKRCGSKIVDMSSHHSKHQQCAHCHYFGITGGVKKGSLYRGCRPKGQGTQMDRWVCSNNIGFNIAAELLMLRSPYDKPI